MKLPIEPRKLEEILPFYREGEKIYHAKNILGVPSYYIGDHHSNARYHINKSPFESFPIDLGLELNWFLEEDYQQFLKLKIPELYHGELKMKFELNKVYRARDGEQWKVVCVEPVNGKLLVVNKIQDSSNWLTFEGKYRNIYGYESEYDLVEFMGDRFSEEIKLREFKFEAYAGELTRYKTKEDSLNTIEKLIGHRTSAFYDDMSFWSLPFKDEGKVSKWEVTMRELPRGDEELNEIRA